MDRVHKETRRPLLSPQMSFKTFGMYKLNIKSTCAEQKNILLQYHVTQAFLLARTGRLSTKATFYRNTVEMLTGTEPSHFLYLTGGYRAQELHVTCTCLWHWLTFRIPVLEYSKSLITLTGTQGTTMLPTFVGSRSN